MSASEMLLQAAEKWRRVEKQERELYLQLKEARKKVAETRASLDTANIKVKQLESQLKECKGSITLAATHWAEAKAKADKENKC